MQPHDKRRDTHIIDLMSKGRMEHAPTEAEAGAPVVPRGPDGITTAELAARYRSILDARAVFYPVTYQFVRELGRGRQGIVMLVLRQGARGCVTQHAIKLYDPELYRSPEEYWTDMGRIAYQVSQLHSLQSPNLVSRHSYEETNGIGYVQMEAIDGIDLARLLSTDHLKIARQNSTDDEWRKFTRNIFRIEGNRVSLQPGFAVYIVRRVLRGLDRLHAMNFLHSDIKPGNVMVDRLGNVKIVDFGRAVLVGERVFFMLGSPQYMSPEMHERKPGRVEADLYSVGLVALELLRGVPLAGPELTNEVDLMRLKLGLKDRLYELLPRDVRKNDVLLRILLRLVDPDPDKRYASARESEAGTEGLVVIEKQLIQIGLDSEYSLDLAEYIAKLVHPRTERVESEPVGPEPDGSG